MKMAMRGSLIAILAGSGLSAFSQEANWTTDYGKAVGQARRENKPILLDFTGSDWCEWCIKMKKETLDTQTFKDYADKNLVLMEVDFPMNKPQPDAVKAQNQDLSQKYQVEGFPTFLLVSKTGKLLWQHEGYLPGGAAAFVAEVKNHSRGAE